MEPESAGAFREARRRGGTHQSRLAQLFRLSDLVPLSVSSVGPLFSVAATGGVMAAYAGWWTLPAILILAVPFIISSFVFRLLNQHFPHSGASYHWSARIIGRGPSRFQAWILILAYFMSIPPIAVPASSYTLAILVPHAHPGALVKTAVAVFWLCFAAVPLLMGGRPTVLITKVFLAVEAFSVAAFVALGLVSLHRLSVPVHFGPPPVAGMLVVAVIAATILDGWEIDSYAAEESARPRSDPGVAGIIGAFLALVFYAVLYPLMFAETPLYALAGASDPLAIWGDRLLPGAPWVVLVPVLASTAGGLWLTTFILSRALYAMGRERIVPSAFSRVSRRRVPHVAIVISLGAAMAVCAAQLLFSSLGSFFDLVLSTAGFFLLAEFFLDSVTASVFLTVGHRRMPGTHGLPHWHRVLRVAAIISSVFMGSLLVIFLIYAPRVVGSRVDEVAGVLLALGIGFAWWTGRRALDAVAFHGQDASGERENLPAEGASLLQYRSEDARPVRS